MGTFQTADEVYAVLGDFISKVMQDPEVGPKFEQANTVMRVAYTDPESEIWVDTTKRPPVVSCGPAGHTGKPEVDIRMPADLGHQFWLGKLNLTVALTRGQASAKGPMSRILKLLPALRPAYPAYRQYLESSGRADLLDACR